MCEPYAEKSHWDLRFRRRNLRDLEMEEFQRLVQLLYKENVVD